MSQNNQNSNIENDGELRSEEREYEENMKKKGIVFTMNATIWECDYHE